MNTLTECVPGLWRPSVSTCGANGTSLAVNTEDWHCNAGYYVVPAPRYCTRMYLSCRRAALMILSRFSLSTSDTGAILRVASSLKSMTLQLMCCCPSECVPGLANPSLATCAGNGGNPTVDAANYTCNSGYFVYPAPVYCQCMLGVYFKQGST